MRHNQEIDDYIPVAAAAASAEPMRRADHKAKKHGRPTRQKHNCRRFDIYELAAEIDIVDVLAEGMGR